MLTLTRLTDLAGPPVNHFTHWQIQSRIQTLITQFLSVQQLNDHLTDLPNQLEAPKPRCWQPIHWHMIEQDQIIGIQPDIFLAIILGAMETEAPIRSYTQTSRQYLSPIHQSMARYVGGQVNHQGQVIEPGLWEKEERQHTPALLRIYRQLTGTKPKLRGREVRGYHPSLEPEVDLYRHGMHRIATEYSAVCLYLWMMAHTTGELQRVFAELLQDEINHMTKFWGFGLWLYPETHLTRAIHLCKHIITRKPKTLDQGGSHRLIHTVQRMTEVLDWHRWSWSHKTELASTFIQVLYRLHDWSDRLSQKDLIHLLGDSPL